MENTAILTKIVGDKDLASFVGSGSLDVLATPVLIAWMEEAACRCVECDEGKTSVGTLIQVSHDKASAPGTAIKVQAGLIEKEGRKLRFEVAAFEGDICISKGIHERFIVDIERFMNKINK